MPETRLKKSLVEPTGSCQRKEDPAANPVVLRCHENEVDAVAISPNKSLACHRQV
jgi:hypothetical protein